MEVASNMRYLAVDYGLSRIGLAVSDESSQFVSPYGTRERVGYKQDSAHIIETVRGLGIGAIVIGLPRQADGSTGEMEATVRKFTKVLKNALVEAGLSIEVDWWDERFSTAEVLQQLREAGISQRSAREATGGGSIDARAAAVILQGYLDAKRQKPITEDEDTV